MTNLKVDAVTIVVVFLALVTVGAAFATSIILGVLMLGTCGALLALGLRS